MAETTQHTQPIGLTDFFLVNFVIPFPPGSPIIVRGQVITAGTITFMCACGLATQAQKSKRITRTAR